MGNHFLGGQRISNNPKDGSDKAWKWNDGTNFEYSAWQPNEANDAYENIIHLWTETNLLWSNIPSGNLYGGVPKM